MAKSSKLSKDDWLYRLRHSLSHIMAQAVLEIRPGARLGFGPPVENGFYYDFLLDEPVSDAEFLDLEQRMRRIIAENQKFERALRPVAESLCFLEDRRQPLKVEYAQDLARRGESSLSFYRNGPFEDMCEGPHLESTGEVPENCFRLDSVAGAYWRGSEKNAMLSRIYGLAFPSAADLQRFLERRDLAKERDHRKLGQLLGIFTFDDDVGRGLPLWLPNGTTVRDELEALAREVEFRGGYQRVTTPHITKGGLYRLSGHLSHYKDSMFPPMHISDEDEDEDYYLKPMNCPHHHKIYASRPRSYRELPLRLAEFGVVYRYERSGQCAGLLRVRGMCQNDSHIYLANEQVKEEVKRVLELHRVYYEMFRLKDYWIRLSLRAPDSEKYVGQADLWELSEKVVREVLQELAIPFVEELGEAAFYGPKIDFQMQTLLGREETAATTQLDFVMAERFGLEFTDRDGQKRRPYIIHRAPLGTHERFLSYLLEHLNGAFPTWLAPVHVRILPVSEKFLGYAARLRAELVQDLFRAELDEGNERLNKKVLEAVTHKIPNLFVVGGRDQEGGTVSWRRYCRGNEQKVVRFEDARGILRTLRAGRVMDNFPDVAVPGW
ncbi:MAG: threonine--tRNA ligase [Planctomycetes bacterium]|nr:threonine--tRNA ligase [Planctomycetota bacterium]